MGRGRRPDADNPAVEAPDAKPAAIGEIRDIS
jgi:hypothetical protein